MSDHDRRRDEPGEFREVHAIRDALATRRHAEMLFEMARDLLGDRAVVETWNGGTRKTLLRRESAGDGMVPWPVATLDVAGRVGVVSAPIRVDGADPDDATPPPRPGEAPNLRGLGPGEMDVHDGPHFARVNYGADGRWFECTRGGPPGTPAGALRALAAKSASPPELLAAWLAGLDHGRHGPARMVVPAPGPSGTAHAWTVARGGLRAALFEGRIPADARWAAADGWTGRAVAWGATREEAAARFLEEAGRVRPWIPEDGPALPPPPPAPPPPKGAEVETTVERTERGLAIASRFSGRGPAGDAPMPPPGAETTPYALVPLEPPPAGASPLGGWARLLGNFGASVHAAFRRERDGWTMAGGRALEAVEAADLERFLAVADIDADLRQARLDEVVRQSVPEAERPPAPDTVVRHYRVFHERTGAPIPPEWSGGRRGRGFHAGGLDGDAIRGEVVRLRRI